MSQQRRYSSLTPQYYWLNFRPTRYAVWTGPHHFYVQSNYQEFKTSGDTASGIPARLPRWEKWLENFENPAGTAYNQASSLRFTFWVRQSPTYAFAMQAESASEQVGIDTIVRTIPDLENWAVQLGCIRATVSRQARAAGSIISS